MREEHDCYGLWINMLIEMLTAQKMKSEETLRRVVWVLCWDLFSKNSSQFLLLFYLDTFSR